jgi:peptide/nickel transport system permease protein
MVLLLFADELAAPRCRFGIGAEGWQFFPPNHVFSLLPPIPFSPEEKNIARALQPPAFPHYLGTDDLGRDAAAVVVHGTRRSVATALTAAFTALALAVFLGAVPGFWGDERLTFPFLALILGGMGAVLGFFCDFWWDAGPPWTPILSAAGLGTGFLFARTRIFDFFPRLRVPMDAVALRLGEIWHSIPVFLALMISTAVLPYVYLTAGIVLGLLQWPAVAWALRAQTRRERECDYVRAAYAVGASDARVFWRHVLPNAMPAAAPVLLPVAAQSVMAEAALAFLGFGPEYPSWGGLMAAARKYPEAWWLALFPGLTLFFFVRFLYRLRGTAT